RREPPVRPIDMRQSDLGGIAVGGITEELRTGELKVQLFIERVREVRTDQRGAAIVTRRSAHLEAVRSETFAVAEIDAERAAIGQQCPEHLALVRPAFDTPARAHAEPFGAAVWHFETVATRYDLRDGIATPRSLAQFEIGLGDVQLAQFNHRLCG